MAVCVEGGGLMDDGEEGVVGFGIDVCLVLLFGFEFWDLILWCSFWWVIWTVIGELCVTDIYLESKLSFHDWYIDDGLKRIE